MRGLTMALTLEQNSALAPHLTRHLENHPSQHCGFFPTKNFFDAIQVNPRTDKNSLTLPAIAMMQKYPSPDCKPFD